ncbi:MAG: hypothetical protein ACFFC3_16390 [Candidatus Odinarchaeota archaeon]
MYYYCPNCTSMKIPQVLNYFPPKTVKCKDCGYINTENKFIKEQEKKFTPLHHTH